MDIVLRWILPIGLLVYMLWQMKQLPKGGRRTYYIILFVILLVAFILRTFFQAI